MTTTGEIKFKGYHWDELSEAFGLPCVEHDEADLKVLGDHIHKQRLSEIVPILRKFLEAIAAQSEKIDYLFPLWKGLLAVEDGETFRTAFVLLLPTMWT